MTQPDVRKPYDHALHMINHTNETLNGVTALPSGRPRDLDAATAVGTLVVTSNLAIAAALLAIADALHPDLAERIQDQS